MRGGTDDLSGEEVGLKVDCSNNIHGARHGLADWNKQALPGRAGQERKQAGNLLFFFDFSPT
ncbi:hypothetical protein BC938DRAFT_473694 [Jimgerdemannia flammicorona]|uniref:Uncharacterized protein n=1 Tax=Jimgerdemannia flammicorona TaxID=994334 RepID=A0A433Q3J9_9FUNG|nr:hypothetical protein BC938DRAFT_473694 [Jimgerdemannia flammicorona]